MAADQGAATKRVPACLNLNGVVCTCSVTLAHGVPIKMETKHCPIHGAKP